MTAYSLLVDLIDTLAVSRNEVALKVYKISHDAPMVSEEMGYTGDCESVAIVIAETEDDARKYWESSEIPADIITVEFIGFASEFVKTGKLCSGFNAG